MSEQAVKDVLNIHRSNGGHNPLCHCGIKPGSDARCVECRKPWPCQTVTILKEAS